MSSSDGLGGPFTDEVLRAPQRIPGRVLCAYYDRGGEGVAFHEAAPRNHGSGELNPLDGSYLHGFRAEEPVGTSYTKADGIDEHPFNRVQPPLGMLYLGWTEPGNWVRYTIQVDEEGEYEGRMLYTSARGGTIALSVDDDPVDELIAVPSTADERDPIAWRQYHHWALLEGIRLRRLSAGEHRLRLHTVGEGGMNYAYLDLWPTRH